MINTKYKNPILLTFVDPEGLEIKFSTLKKISEGFSMCDFIVNVNSDGVKRVQGRYEGGDDRVKGKLTEYYDKDIQQILYDLEQGKNPERQYEEAIKKSLGRKVGSVIEIHGSRKKIAYYLLAYTRETRGGSQYAKIFKTLEDHLKHTDGKKVMRTLETIFNRQSRIGDFPTR